VVVVLFLVFTCPIYCTPCVHFAQYQRKQNKTWENTISSHGLLKYSNESVGLIFVDTYSKTPLNKHMNITALQLQKIIYLSCFHKLLIVSCISCNT